MRSLKSYVGGQWVASSNRAATLYNPSTEEAIAEIAAGEVDWKEMLAYSREKGAAALQALTFAQRGEILQAMAKALHEGREELITLATQNGGNTRGDAKFDIDGASFTLAAYADIGAKLGDTKILADGDPEQIGRTARFSAQHIRLPRAGVGTCGKGCSSASRWHARHKQARKCNSTRLTSHDGDVPRKEDPSRRLALTNFWQLW
jgi:3,4-dehydroadipyl-CoA semialdehyde dehydrogenase